MVLNRDESALLVGRFDTGNLLEIEITLDVAAGETITTHTFGEVTLGFDGITAWRGQFFAVHDGGDGSSLVIVDALICFKTFVNVSKLVKSGHLTILEKKVLPAASIPFEVKSV